MNLGFTGVWIVCKSWADKTLYAEQPWQQGTFLTLHDHRIWFACVIVWRGFFCPPHIHGNSLVCVRFHFDDSSFKGSLRVRGQHTLLQQCYQKTHHIDFYLVWFSDMVNERWTQVLIKFTTAGFSSMSPAHLSQPIIVFAEAYELFKMQHIIKIWK